MGAITHLRKDAAGKLYSNLTNNSIKMQYEISKFFYKARQMIRTQC